MKKIFNISILSLLFLSIMSCSTDDNKIIVEESTNPVLIAPEDGANIILNPSTDATTALTLVWDHAAYSIDTEIDYVVEMAAAGTDFAAPITIVTTTSRVVALTGAELRSRITNAPDDNTAGLGLVDTEDTNIQVRVTATLGNNDDLPMVSDPISFSVTFQTGEVVVEPEEPALFLVGSPQGYYGVGSWTPTEAIPMRYIGDGETLVFEAYVKVGAADEFKFVGAQADWNDQEVNLGTIGGAQDGNLENGGGSQNLIIAQADGDGLYYIQVDVDELTYKVVKMEWGIIGDSTTNGWDGETAMTYDFASNTWSISTTLADGGMKFRSANTGNFIYSDAWKFNIGDSDPMVTYDPTAPNFTITAGSYDLGLIVNFDGTATVSGL